MNMEHRITGIVKELAFNEIFTFGSNLSGFHGKGSALQAKRWGAKYGEGVGLWGRTYAIPTKDYKIKTLPLRKIVPYVEAFIECAECNPDCIFLVTEIGCGLAGYTPEDIAPMFKECIELENVKLPLSFWKILGYEKS